MSASSRLREERERLGRSQAEFAAIGGVTRTAQGNYEAGKRSPDMVYLAAVAGAGADVLYIVTGRRAGGPAEADTVAAERRLAEFEARLAAGEALSAGERTELEAFALGASLPDRTRAFADRLLRYQGDEAAEARHQERDRRRDAAMQRAAVIVRDACRRLGWAAPPTAEAALIRVAVEAQPTPDLIDFLMLEMWRLSVGNGTS